MLILGLVNFSNAQCLPDQNITDPGFYPDKLDTAWAGSKYQQVLQIRLIKDTIVEFSGNKLLAKIDSAEVLKVSNLPGDLGYQCDLARCVFIPDSTGCVLLSGNPTTQDIGSYPLEIEIKLYARINGSIPVTQNDTIRDFTLVVAADPASVGTIGNNAFSIHPNPSNTGIFSVDGIEFTHFSTYDALGRKVMESDISNGVIDCSSLENGLYWIRMESNLGVASKKIVIRR